ncbi:hypothetical protein H2199_002758 [Coniosporium tulheliwenetii]|uniref:Uncharacterized protein n=1 Tax=Coniosporium tulheliwenetii TaxID=3383036 RepID=A0ACC2ZDA7_9PEZI|nr:hypothetical protein H2199_002758 [Cladosporium sp. JES 115]
MSSNLQRWTSGVPISYNTSFTPTQYERIKRGHVPMEMEDKWYIYYEEPHLWFVRSWTGLRVFRVTLRECGNGRGGAEEAQRTGGAKRAEELGVTRGTAGTDGGHGGGHGRGRGQGQGHGGGDGAGRGRGQGHNDRGHDWGHERAYRYTPGSGREDGAAVVKVAEALWARELAKDKAMIGFQVEGLKSLVENLLLHQSEENEREAFPADGEEAADGDMAGTTQEEKKKSRWRFWKG